MIVLSRPAAGREDEYNDWYQNFHLSQVVNIRDIKSAQRFRLARKLVEGEASPYAAIYEIETDDIDAVVDEIKALAGTESLQISDALATDFTNATIYEEFGAVVRKP
ncbi:hypothetical protein [Stenotrophobium rhamnosiphilum]|uniref:hypothetical protein n=1 Tax=Stenotrophobium rhamnosiphilum TaxID=2029166 RepID=UPI0019D1460F|nr:hypothetical protein [Stenotrophobium rhamnosiphilum]